MSGWLRKGLALMLSKVKAALVRWLVGDLAIQITVLHKRMNEVEETAAYTLEQILKYNKKLEEMRDAFNDLLFMEKNDDEKVGKD